MNPTLRTALAGVALLSSATAAPLVFAGAAQAEQLTLCWAAWDPANALVELSKDFTAQSEALVGAAKSADEAKFRAQFDKLKSSCKACHDKYRSE